MPKQPTEKQLAARKAFGEAAKARAAAKKEIEPTAPELPNDLKEDVEDHIADEQSVSEILRQLKEVQESNALLKAAFANQNTSGATTSISMDRNGELIGEFEKYSVDPSDYPDPTKRLAEEPRLSSIAFNYNYELEYSVGVAAYPTATGKRVREPRFFITLNRIVVNDQGEQTNKRYIAKKLIFHEDPDAALVIARDNGIEVDKSDEKLFLNEMRYLRVRDWLFDIFWAKPAQEQAKIREEVIGGTVVQVFTKASEEASGIEFDKLRVR